MSQTHTLDLERLNKLKDQRDSAFATNHRTYEELRELNTRRGRLQGEISILQRDSRANMINPQRSIATETAKLTSEITALEFEIAALSARAEPVRERANSLGRLYDRCVEFLGGNGNDR